ncbi:MAG: ATP-dependent Clp protease ATP-binding subunit ClpC, partial [Thermoplasmata archaeon]
ATTPDEYRRYIEKDSALERRFQPIWVEEPSPEMTVDILRGLKEKYESHHGVKISDDALEAAVKLTHRYLQGRRLPDKAIDVLDQACARKKIRSYPTSEDREREELEAQVKELEEKVKKAEEEGNLKEWERLNSELTKKKRELLSRKDRKEDIEVKAEDIAEIVADMTGIPVSKMMEEEKDRLLRMEEELHRRIIGQDEAVKVVSEAIRRSRAGVSDPRRPLGTFLFLGPTGVGKTELARSLAEFLFGDEDAILRLDMSEFKEEHSIAKLIGAPPGYVGYEEGGKLTEAVRRRPYQVILLDEIEKAHPRVFDLFLQVFDDGRLTDSQGRTVSFRNTVIIMTSNIGSEYLREVMDRFKDRMDEVERALKTVREKFEKGEISEDVLKAEEERLGRRRKEIEEEIKREYEKVREKVLEIVRGYFRPEFLNRIDEIVVFHPLSKEEIFKILDILIERLNRRLEDQKIKVTLTDRAKELLSRKGFDPLMGARPLRRVIQKEIETELSSLILKGDVKEGDEVVVDEKDGKFEFKVPKRA